MTTVVFHRNDSLPTIRNDTSIILNRVPFCTSVRRNKSLINGWLPGTKYSALFKELFHYKITLQLLIIHYSLITIHYSLLKFFTGLANAAFTDL